MILSVEHYQKSYGDTVAVRDLSFHLEPGDIVGLVGPNGAGKTTTMRAIAGIIPPSSGRITIAGHDVRAEPVPAKRQLAYVPDDPKLFDALTVDEHLKFIAAAYHVPDYQREADALLEKFDLTEKRSALAMELSRGMRQKVAICCAYLHKPKVILLDEPLTGLDPRGIRTMKESIRVMATGDGASGEARGAGGGTAFLVSSHLLALVEDLCDKLLILHKGRRLFFGNKNEARAAFAGGAPQGAAPDASLEEVFFRATEGHLPDGELYQSGRPSADRPGAAPGASGPAGGGH